MSMFGDYQAYKTHVPEYNIWKQNRDIIEAKRTKYLEQHPETINQEDIQKSKTLLRAIDIMDEYSQKRAEDMEMATESITEQVLFMAAFVGSGLGFALSNIEAVNQRLQKVFKKIKNPKLIAQLFPTIIGGIVATAAVFPIEAWAAKAQVSASRKGRFEAMRKDLTKGIGKVKTIGKIGSIGNNNIKQTKISKKR